MLVEEICQKAFDLSVDEIHFTNFIYQGNSKKNNFKQQILTEDQILEALKQINEQRKKYDIKTLKITRCGSFGNVIGSKNYYCDGGIGDIVITPDNKVYPCIFLAGIEKYKIGEYVDGNVVFGKKVNHDCKHCFAKQILNENIELKDFITDN